MTKKQTNKRISTDGGGGGSCDSRATNRNYFQCISVCMRVFNRIHLIRFCRLLGCQLSFKLQAACLPVIHVCVHVFCINLACRCVRTYSHDYYCKLELKVRIIRINYTQYSNVLYQMSADRQFCKCLAVNPK